VNANKTMDDCKRGFVGVSANFAVTAALLLNAASIGFQPLHPTSLALMPPPAAPAADRRETSHVDERGDHKVEEHEEQICERRGRREHGEHVEQSRRGADLARTDLAGWSGSG
jgi:hypothetical protein